MRRMEFPEWPEALAQAQIPERLKHSFEITIRWYLSFCQRGRGEVTVQSARDFIAWAVEQKRPQQWQVEQWKDAIRWFFRASKDQGGNAGGPEQPVWLPPAAKTGWPEWKVAFLTRQRTG
jgi:hypothetical protein